MKTRLIDTVITETREGIRSSLSLSLFKELNTNYEIAPYLKLLCYDKDGAALANYAYPHIRWQSKLADIVAYLGRIENVPFVT